MKETAMREAPAGLATWGLVAQRRTTG